MYLPPIDTTPSKLCASSVEQVAGDCLADLIDASLTPSIPPIEEFILSPDYLDLDGHVCDAVLTSLRQVFDPAANYREAAFAWGIGGGKSFLSSICSVYMAYRLLCMPDPQAYYGLAPGSEIAVVNFSVSATQAKHVVFGEILARINHAPCFKQAGFQRDPKINSELRWPEKKIIIFPGNSQAESAIGYNVIAAVIDEAAWLPDVESTVRVAGRSTGGKYDAAEELYNALSKRLKSRGNARFRRDGKLVMISSPRYVGDFMERKIAEAEENPHIFASRLPTWEGAPKRSLSGETFLDEIGEVPVEYKEEFDRDQERARRDLGAQPSEAIQPFFTNREALLAALDDTLPDLMDGLDLRADVAFGPEQRFAHIDLGITHDRAGLAVAHWEGSRLIYDLVTYFEAADFAGGEVDLEHIRQVLFDMRAAGCKFSVVSFDGFQSVDSRQLLKKAGINSEYLSVDKTTAPYDTLKELAYGYALCIPDTPRGRLFFEEARRLELTKGKKVDHPPRGSKDVADACAGVAVHAAAERPLTTVKVVGVGAVAARAQAARESSGSELGVMDQLGNVLGKEDLRRMRRIGDWRGR